MDSIETLVVNSSKLTNIFGHWPSFHDAEVIDLHLRLGDIMPASNIPRIPVLAAQIHLWELTDQVDLRGYYVVKNHTLATLRFKDARDIELRGFSIQNVIFGLSIKTQEHSQGPWKRTFDVEFEPVAQFGLTFSCSEIEVVQAGRWEETR